MARRAESANAATKFRISSVVIARASANARASPAGVRMLPGIVIAENDPKEKPVPDQNT
jgi:hypothetical protein